MSWFSSVQLNSMEALLIDQLQDLYDAEQTALWIAAQNGGCGSGP